MKEFTILIYAIAVAVDDTSNIVPYMYGINVLFQLCISYFTPTYFSKITSGLQIIYESTVMSSAMLFTVLYAEHNYKR